MEYEEQSIFGLRNVLSFTQQYMGMLLGMGKQHVSRIEKGCRKETLQHKEILAMLAFLNHKGQLNEYVEWRFGLSINRRFYKKSTPMDDLKRKNKSPIG
jgi:DNA-binding XRE family transcriptional regulator